MGSLDNLKKDAKRWLRLLEAGDAEARVRFDRAFPKGPKTPVLRDVQHALAREYGFDSWSRMIAAVPASAPDEPAPTLDRYDAVAHDLHTVYATDDAAALSRLGAYYRAPLTGDDVRAIVWQRVRRVREAKGAAAAFTLDESRDLVARELGHGGWDALATYLVKDTAPPPAPAFVVKSDERAAGPRRLMTPSDWDRLIAVIKEQRIPRLVAHGQMTDVVIARVVELEHVTELQLGGSRLLTDDGLRQLARMPQLEVLDISDYPGGVLTDRGLEVLQHLPNLRRFLMSWQGAITDVGLAHLRHCPKLEVVHLMGSRTGDGVVEALRAAPQLADLQVGRLLTDDGVRMIRSFPSLRKLMLDGPFSDAGLTALAGMDVLQGLSFFWYASAMTSAGLSVLERLPNLQDVSIDGGLCDDTALRHVGAMPDVRQLGAQGAVATDAGYIALSRSRTLESIWGREMTALGPRGFAALSTMPAIRSLAVNCVNVGDALARLPEFPSLRKLTSIGISDDGFRQVGRCQALEELSCMYCRDTTDRAVEHLASLERLRMYYAGATQITDAGLEALSRVASLEEIELYETLRVTDAGLPHLAAMPRLRKVGLAGIPHVSAAGTRVFPSSVAVDYWP